MTAQSPPTASLETSPPAALDAAALYQEGMIAGILGAAAVAVWFLLLDALAGRPFWTPTVLGTALFRRGAGLDAVEALHPDHVPTQAEAYERWAADLGLLVTAGSDFHGPAVQPDRKLGDRTLSAERFAALEERSRRQ